MDGDTVSHQSVRPGRGSGNHGGLLLLLLARKTCGAKQICAPHKIVILPTTHHSATGACTVLLHEILCPVCACSSIGWLCRVLAALVNRVQ